MNYPHLKLTITELLNFKDELRLQMNDVFKYYKFSS